MSVQLKRSNGAWEFLAGGLNANSSSGYDGGLSVISDNAVQNKVITIAINGIRADIGDIQADISSINSVLSDIDTAPTANSTKLVQSGGVYTSIKSVDDKLKDTITTTDQALPESEILDLISEVDKLKPVGTTSDPTTLTLDRDHAVYAYNSDDTTTLSNFPDDNLTGYTILVLSGSNTPTLFAFNNGKAWLRINNTWEEIATVSELAEFVSEINQLTDTINDSTPFVISVTKDNTDPHKVNVTSTTANDLNNYIESKYDTEATEDSVHALTSGEIYNIKEHLQTQIDALEGARIYKGSSSTIPSLDDVQVGWVYNITDSFTTTDDFVEGAGKSVTAGSDIACINVGTSDSPIKKWDIMADTSLFQKRQLSSPITIDGDEYTTVEDTLNALSSSALAIIEVENISDVTEVQECIYHDTTTGWYYFGKENGNVLTRIAIEDDVPTVVNYVDALPTTNIKDELYVYNNKTYRGNKEDQTLIEMHVLDWVGTQAEYDALVDKSIYGTFYITDSIGTGLTVSDSVTDGDLNPVTSNAVYNAINGVTVSNTPVLYSGYTGTVAIMRRGKLIHLFYQNNGTPPSSNTSTLFATGLPKPLMNLSICTQEVNGNGRYVFELRTDGALYYTPYGNTTTAGTWITYNQVYFEA